MFKNSKKFVQIISYLNCMSAGILIGVVFLDVLPETGKSLNAACNDYPLSFVLTVTVLFLMTLFLKLGHTHSHGDSHDHHHDHDEQHHLHHHDDSDSDSSALDMPKVHH